jgi:hypothetical protein
MAVYTVYYDASGTDRDLSRPLVVAGLLSTELRWRRFEREWEGVLKQFNVPYSHMKEFAHSVDGSPFEKWKGNEEKRKAFLVALVEVLHHFKVAHTTRIVPNDFNAVNQEFDLTTALGSPYVLGAGGCVGVYERLRERKHWKQAFEHILEQGDEAQKLFKSLIELEGISPILKPHHDPKTGRYIRPFEAADLFAYEYGLAYQRLLSGSDRKVRELLKAVRRRIPQMNHNHTRESLRDMCEAYPDMFPRRA